MPVVKVTDLAYCRLQSPSLDVSEEFLTRFGLTLTRRTHDRLFMRGTDPQARIHITHLGSDARCLGLAFHVESEDDLKAASKMSGASGIENVDEPGGGKRVRLKDPMGYEVELITGMTPLAKLPTRRHVLNWGDEKLRRAGELMRLDSGPSQVKRIAHAVYMTPNAMEKVRWYREALGLVSSDDVYAGSPDNIIASFNRCDRGETFVDHHTFLCIEGPKSGLQHISFEVQNFDDVMLGHEHLKAANRYQHMWGIGRHVLGSQIFDYWQDPWGQVHEHWCDTDMLNNHARPNLLPAEEGLSSQWGAPVPTEFITHCTP